MVMGADCVGADSAIAAGRNSFANDAIDRDRKCLLVKADGDAAPYSRRGQTEYGQYRRTDAGDRSVVRSPSTNPAESLPNKV